MFVELMEVVKDYWFLFVLLASMITGIYKNFQITSDSFNEIKYELRSIKENLVRIEKQSTETNKHLMKHDEQIEQLNRKTTRHDQTLTYILKDIERGENK